MATQPSGKARVCNTRIIGSIPIVASIRGPAYAGPFDVEKKENKQLRNGCESFANLVLLKSVKSKVNNIRRILWLWDLIYRITKKSE